MMKSELKSELANLWVDYLYMLGLKHNSLINSVLGDIDIETSSGIQKQLDWIEYTFKYLAKDRAMNEMLFERFKKVQKQLEEFKEEFEEEEVVEDGEINESS